MGGYDYLECPDCHARDFVPGGGSILDPITGKEVSDMVWAGVIYGTDGNDMGYGRCFSCGAVFVMEPRTLRKITQEEADELTAKYTGAKENT